MYIHALVTIVLERAWAALKCDQLPVVMAAILTDLFLFSFETTQYKNQFDADLVKIHSAVVEILSISFSVLFLITADGCHLGRPYCKKSIRLHAIIILVKGS